METLSKLFGSETRVRMMRLFLFNPDDHFEIEQIMQKTQANKREVVKELDFMKKLGLIKKKKGAHVFSFDKVFEFTEELSDFLIRTNTLEYKAILKKINKQRLN